MEKDVIDLAAHANSSTCRAALDRMDPYLKGEIVSVADLEAAYQTIYEFVGAPFEDTFVLSSSAAEAACQVLWSVFLEVSRKTGKCHFIASVIEDAPTMQMLKRLEELGCFVKFAPVNELGQIDVEALKALVSPRTALISVTVAHGLTGVIQPVEEIALLAKEKGILLHLDAAYALGKYDFSSVRPDYMTFSGERLHALKSSGGLFVKKGAPLAPLIVGGSDQGGFRGGTLDLAALFALSAAVSQIQLSFDAMSLEMARLRDLLETEIQRHIPDARVLFRQMLRLPNTTAMIFPGAHYEALQYLLLKRKVMSVAGGSYFQHLHRILAASKIEGAESALSFSIDRMMVEEDILRAAQIIAKEARILRFLSEDL